MQRPAGDDWLLAKSRYFLPLAQAERADRSKPVNIEADRLSLDDLVIASFTTGPGATTLPIRIYSEVRLGVKPEINAVCTIFIAVVAVAVVAALLVGGSVGFVLQKKFTRVRAEADTLKAESLLEEFDERPR